MPSALGRGDAFKNMRILIVDDDELSLAILEGVLDEMGYEVEPRQATGRESRLTKLHEGNIHVVITDWRNAGNERPGPLPGHSDR